MLQSNKHTPKPSVFHRFTGVEDTHFVFLTGKNNPYRHNDSPFGRCHFDDMNLLSAILPVTQVLVRVEVANKKRAFEEAGLLFQREHGLNRTLVTDSLFARERLGSTALGHGVAVPHGRIKGLKQPLAAVFHLLNPIGFDAPDDAPVNLLIFLLVPETATQRHLDILAEIASLLSESSLRQEMQNVLESTELHRLITNWHTQSDASL